MNHSNQDETVYVGSLYSLLAELEDIDLLRANQNKKIGFANDVLSLRGKFFDAFNILIDFEEDELDSEFENGMPKGYGHEMSDDNQTENYCPSSQELVELYCDVLLKALGATTSYSIRKTELVYLLSNLAKYCSDEHRTRSEIDLYVQDEYTMKSYGKECKKAVSYCSNILEALLDQSDLTDPDYEKILTDEFSFERFEAMMTRAVAYLVHRVENLDVLLNIYDGVDPREYDTQDVDAEVQQYRNIHERAMSNLQDFSELIEQVKDVLECTSQQMSEQYYSKSTRQLCKLSDTLRIREDFVNPAFRFAHCFLANRNGRIPTKVDVIHSMIALQDLFRVDKTILGRDMYIRGAYSVEDHVKFFLDLPDAVLEYFIDNDVLDQVLSSSADASPLPRIIGEDLSIINSQRYQDFCCLAILRSPETLGSHTVDKFLPLTKQLLEELKSDLEEVSQVYLMEQLFPTSDKQAEPPQQFLNLN